MPVRPRSSRAAALLLAAAVAVTTAAGTASALARGPRPAAPAALDGVWRMDGYGTVAVVEDGGRKLHTYETTAVSCLPGALTAARTDPSGPFRQDGEAALTVTPQGRDTARLAFGDNVGHRTLHRIPALPSGCGNAPSPAPDADPRAVFDTFWQTYAENYPFFAARHIDWNAVRDRYRPRITATTSKPELFRVLSRMIEPLHDGHTGLVDPDDPAGFFAGHRQDTVIPDATARARIDKAVAESVTKAGAGSTGVQRSWAGGQITYAELPGRTGFLRITSFLHYGQGNDYDADKAALHAALDEVFTAARTTGPDALRGLVLDLRLNGGGSDRLALDVAERLTARPYTAYLKHARNDARDPRRFTPAEPIRVAAHDGPVYTGPLTVLTGRLTMSAGETLTQALLQRGPKPTLIGENTQGLFSDRLMRTLPNGWQFWLPNEEFLSAKDGRTTYDGTGIAPDVRTTVFAEEDLATGKDPALTKALELLRSGRH
ncbi:S41 family peptidase [Streptomyces roseoverticillatus]|uniref:S41 family peptidase n=1 Tax=Streptomyces roseoverticillatus TaxID=66429 RepID=UPI001F1ABBD5|nr:S41 family peptidase [Streptomyces roseoverticillatus]MCF3100599.1 S41 family peptidase [Streptomyces roseoverticillatus]